jgi:DNA-binding transcriptional MocR family regulator
LPDGSQRATIGTVMTVPIALNVAGSRLSGPELADLLGQWTVPDGPLYRLLAGRIARLADTGQLPSGLLLPPERDLADALSVSRNTAAAAYQMLRDEGLAQTRRGAGTRIGPHRVTPAGVHRANGFFAAMLEAATVDVDLGVAAPDCAPQVLAALDEPVSVLGTAARREATSGSGHYPFGLPSLRAVIAGLLTARHALPTTPEQVLVTTGAQQGIDLLVRSQVRTGQPIVVEDPTFPGALDAMHRAGARLIGIPASDGLDPQRLEMAVSTHRPALVYLIPTYHNPAGHVMPPGDRARVAELAAAHPDTLFVDDASLAELVLDPEPSGSPVRPLAAPCPLLPNLATLGSLSKTYWPGLRVGWIRASTGTIAGLAAAKAAADLGSAAHPQAIAAALMTSRHAEILDWRAAQLRARRDALQDALRAHLPGWSWTPPRGGLALWVRLTRSAGQATWAKGSAENVNAAAFAQAALRHGVAVVPGRLLSATNSDHGSVRIAFTQPPEQLRRAAPALARAWQPPIPRPS